MINLNVVGVDLAKNIIQVSVVTPAVNELQKSATCFAHTGLGYRAISRPKHQLPILHRNMVTRFVIHTHLAILIA
jgi:hypothetical protein